MSEAQELQNGSRAAYDRGRDGSRINREERIVKHDIDAALRSWEYQPGKIQARLVEASDSRQVIQMRVDLGILQLERKGRPDGTRPHGLPTYFDYLKQPDRAARGTYN